MSCYYDNNWQNHGKVHVNILMKTLSIHQWIQHGVIIVVRNSSWYKGYSYSCAVIESWFHSSVVSGSVVPELKIKSWSDI